MSNFLSNIVELNVVLAVNNRECGVSGMSASELPWLENTGESYELQPRVIIEENLLPLLNGTQPLESRLAPVMEKVAVNLASHFKDALEIYCDFKLHLMFEELEDGALLFLVDRLGITDPDSLNQSISTIGSLDWKQSSAVAKEGAAHADIGAHFHLEKAEHNAVPGSAVTITMQNKHTFPLFVEAIRLLRGERVIVEHLAPKELPPNKSILIHLPGIPVRHYGPLSQSDEALDIELQFLGAMEPLRLKAALKVSVEPLEERAASLFFDMGSVQFKQMRLKLGTDPNETDYDAKEWTEATAKRLAKSNVHGRKKEIWVFEPKLTQRAIQEIGLPEFSKEQIDHFDDRQIAAHFARAVQLVARDQYARNRRLIGDFYWAFPDLRESRNFDAINKEVNQLVNTSVLGKVVIVEESECLRRQFAQPLNALSKAALEAIDRNKKGKKQRHKQEEAFKASKKAWEHYEELGFIGRTVTFITGNRPQKPSASAPRGYKIPDLREWHKMFSAIACDPQLSDFLVFDAGGYSLDVYASIKDLKHPFSKSFKAGSREITADLRTTLAEQRGRTLEEIDIDEAERIKCNFCDPKNTSSGILANRCELSTKEIYEKPILEAINWLRKNSPKRGVPVILSGGGSRNRFLRELISKHLESSKIDTVPIDSDLIFHALRESKQSDVPRIELFMNVVSAFHPEDEFPRYSTLTDVIGGLSAMALEQATTKPVN